MKIGECDFWALRAGLAACLLGLSFCLTACGSTTQENEAAQQARLQAEAEAKAKAEAEAKAKAEAEAEAKAKAKQGNIKVDITEVIVADEEFSNLQTAEADVPMYDRFTLAQRRQLGLTTELPKLKAPAGKVAYLTFDDGPDDKNTQAILDILTAEDAPATFYVVGTQVERYPEIIGRIYEEGHALANHSYDHKYKQLYASEDAFLAEMEKCDEAIYKILGLRPLNLRAPGGAGSSLPDGFWQNLREYGYVEHDWNVCCQDAVGEAYTAEEMVCFVQKDLQVGMDHAIVLMHSTAAKTETVKALPGIIQALRERGYSFGVMTPLTPQPW